MKRAPEQRVMDIMAPGLGKAAVGITYKEEYNDYDFHS